MAVALSGSIVLEGSITGSLLGTASYSSNTEFFDGLDSSVFALTSSLGSFTSSLNDFSSSINTYTASNNANIAALNAATASLYNATASLYLTTASLNQYTASLNTRSASFACVDSTNNFACAQYFSNASNAISFSSTGSLYSDGGMRLTKDLYVSGTSYFNNVTIFGTQSVNYITSSQLNIASNIITVNTATPTVRFGGLAVYDSGSLGTGLTGSMLWDSEDNQWIYSNPSGSEFDSAVFLVGPRNVGALGNEVGISCNFLSKGNGMHHITSSGIFEDGTRTCFYGNTVIGSGGTVCTTMANASCVGIGTTTPSKTLDVIGSGKFSDGSQGLLVQAFTGGSGFGSIYPSTVTPSNTNHAFAASNNATVINVTGSGVIDFEIGTNSKMYITNAGNIGIGTTSPQAILAVEQDYTTTAEFGSHGQFSISGKTNSEKRLDIGFNTSTDVGFIQAMVNGTSYNNLLLNARGGNVGIGTINPLVKLTIQDDATFCNTLDNGQFRIQGNTSCAKKLFLGVDTSCSTAFGYIQATETGVSVRSLILQPSGGQVGIGMNTPCSNVGKWLWLGDRTALVDDLVATSYLMNNATFCGVFQRVRNGYASNITLDANGDFNISMSGCSTAGSTACFTNMFVVKNSGKVGIGANTPQQILSVNNPFSSLDALYPVIISQTGNAEIGGIYSTADSITNPIGAGLAFKTYQINVGLTEKLRITHGGYVGIGCTAPSGKLQVANSSTQYALYTLGGNLELYTPEGNCGYVRLGSAYNLNGVYGSCGLNYIVSGTSAHAFRTTDNNTERLRIFSTGEACFSCQVCAPRLQLNYCSTSAVLSIGNQDSTNDAGVRGLSIITDRLRFGVSPITSTYGAIATNGTNSGITFVTYDTAWCERVRIECTGIACFACQVCAPAGVKFGNGSTILNYYEQGTWTPRLKNGSFTTNAGTGNAAWYVRVGNIVTVGGTLSWTGGSGAQDGNSLQIACLPFSANSSTGHRNVGQFGAPASDSIGFKNACAQMTLVIDPGASYIYIIENYQNGTYLTYTHSPCANTSGTIYGFQATYQI